MSAVATTLKPDPWNQAWVPVGSVRKPPIGRKIMVMRELSRDKGILIPQNIFFAIYKGERISPQENNQPAITQEIWQLPANVSIITHWLNNAET